MNTIMQEGYAKTNAHLLIHACARMHTYTHVQIHTHPNTHTNAHKIACTRASQNIHIHAGRYSCNICLHTQGTWPRGWMYMYYLLWVAGGNGRPLTDQSFADYSVLRRSGLLPNQAYYSCLSENEDWNTGIRWNVQSLWISNRTRFAGFAERIHHIFDEIMCSMYSVWNEQSCVCWKSIRITVRSSRNKIKIVPLKYANVSAN